MQQRETCPRNSARCTGALTANNVPIAQLANGKRVGGEESGQLKWDSRPEGIEQLRVIAIIGRDRLREDGEYRERCQIAEWELPLVEVTYRNRGFLDSATLRPGYMTGSGHSES